MYIQPARNTEHISARPRGLVAGSDAAASTLTRPPVLRPGCMDHLQHPSRAGDRLTYPDGRTGTTDHATSQPLER